MDKPQVVKTMLKVLSNPKDRKSYLKAYDEFNVVLDRVIGKLSEDDFMAVANHATAGLYANLSKKGRNQFMAVMLLVHESLHNRRVAEQG